jgi:hypothetical protein
MKTVIQKKSLGIVLDGRLLCGAEAPGPLRAHLVLNQRLLDENGYACVTRTAGFLEILDIIDQLKAELDSLANETILWLAQSIASRRTRFEVVCNRDWHGGAGGEDSKQSVPPSYPGTTLALPKIHAGPWPSPGAPAEASSPTQPARRIASARREDTP